MFKNNKLFILIFIIALYTELCRSKCRSNSQSFEDLILFKVCFQNLKQPGVYLEAGALDGVTLSNTYFYEKCLNWTGILIEPSPASYARLEKKRPNNLLLNVTGCKERKN